MPGAKGRMNSADTGHRWAAVLCMVLLARGLAVSEEAKAPPPRSILDHAQGLELTNDQQAKIRAILSDHETALGPLRDKADAAGREVEKLIADEGDLEAIHVKLQEEADLRVGPEVRETIAAHEIARLLTDGQRSAWREVRRAKNLYGQGPTWPVEDEAEAPPRSQAHTGPPWSPFHRRPYTLTDQQISAMRKLLGNLAKTLKAAQARLTALASELDGLVDGSGDEAAIRSRIEEETRLRAEARLKDIETSRRVNALLTKEQLAAWKAYQAEQRGDAPSQPPPSDDRDK